VLAAIAAVPSLTNADASRLVRQSYGILLDDLPMEQAQAARDSLAASGHETEIVEQTFLELPRPQVVRRAACTPTGFVTYDLYGRPTKTPWDDILVLSAGCYAGSTSVKVQDAEFVRSSIDMASTFLPAQYEYQETDELLLQVLTKAGARYRILSDGFDYSYLGQRRAAFSGKNFAELVRDLIGHAGQAAANWGARAMSDDKSRIVRYASPRLFDREACWLRWRHGGSPAPLATDAGAAKASWERSLPDSTQILEQQKQALEQKLDNTRQLDRALAVGVGALAAFYLDGEFDFSGAMRWVALIVTLAVVAPLAHASIRASRRRQHWTG